MADLAQRSKEFEDGMLTIGSKLITLKDVVVYSLLIFAIGALGLMNWAELTFDIDNLTLGYIAHSLFQILAYASIITSFGIKQLDKRKELSKKLHDARTQSNKILKRYRPLELKKYVMRENMDAKKEAFVDKYTEKLDEFEKKHEKREDYFTLERSWKEYKDAQHDNDKLPEEERTKIEPPNDYCKEKEFYLDRMHKPYEYFEDENIDYDKFTREDLTSGIRAKGKGRVPRGTEGGAMTANVSRNIFFMTAWSFLTAGIALGASQGGIDAVAKTGLTIILALWSAFKGLAVGERVFESVTLEKELWRQHHLHAYAVMEASENNYNIYKLDKENK